MIHKGRCSTDGVCLVQTESEVIFPILPYTHHVALMACKFAIVWEIGAMVFLAQAREQMGKQGRTRLWNKRCGACGTTKETSSCISNFSFAG